MGWVLKFFGSSVGRKLLMAATGLCFVLFLTTHLAGNLLLYRGGEAFNTYAARLHSLGPLLTMFELALLALALIHVVFGLWLFYENNRARPVKYAVKKSGGGQTWGSATMPYTGVLILAFVIYHLIRFHFVDKTTVPIYEIVQAAFQNSFEVALYVAAMAVVALHVSHGFWSAFQTLGAHHTRYTPIIKGVGLIFSMVVGIGFGFIPVYMRLL